MVKKCLECKYFKKGSYNGECELRSRYKRNCDTCEDFTYKGGETKNNQIQEYAERLDELELRILVLERLVNKYL